MYSFLKIPSISFSNSNIINIFTGLQCETEVNECDLLLPCQHNATCDDLLNDYTCSCVVGYTDKNCSTNIDDCVPNPCYHDNQCIDGVNSYTCICSSGFTGTVFLFELTFYSPVNTVKVMLS